MAPPENNRLELSPLKFFYNPVLLFLFGENTDVPEKDPGHFI